MPTRIPIVGVIGSGTHEHRSRANEVGRWLAVEGVHLLTGGGQGVMAAVSRAFQNAPGRRGLVIGIIPCGDNAALPKTGYPNQWVDLPIYTHLPLSGASGTERLSRNHINVLSSNVIIALPGGRGTASEVQLALDYKRPIIAYVGARSDIPDLPSEVLACDDILKMQEFVRASATRRSHMIFSL